jgi:hypothetical protein
VEDTERAASLKTHISVGQKPTRMTSTSHTTRLITRRDKAFERELVVIADRHQMESDIGGETAVVLLDRPPVKTLPRDYISRRSGVRLSWALMEAEKAMVLLVTR